MPYTTSLYWDCNCESNYIHKKTENVCPVCGAELYDENGDEICDYPDSVRSEVMDMLVLQRNFVAMRELENEH